jgi:hypothetical protein
MSARGWCAIAAVTVALGAAPLPSTAGPDLPDPGGERTVTHHDDGGRTVEVRGRNVEPRDLTTRYDSEGRVIEREGVHSDGRIDRMRYDPTTGERRQTSVAADGATTRTRTQEDGSSVMVQTGFGPRRVTTERDGQGHARRTTERQDGTSRVETWSDDGPVTTTEYDARGRPTSSETPIPGGGRVRTEFDERGDPVKTEALGVSDFPYAETTYWPGGDVPRRTRVFHRGEVAEVIYYDEDGREVRRSRERDNWMGLSLRWVFEDGDDGPSQRHEGIPRAPEDVADEAAGADDAARRARRPTPDVPNRPTPRPGY